MIGSGNNERRENDLERGRGTLFDLKRRAFERNAVVEITIRNGKRRPRRLENNQSRIRDGGVQARR
jgi:hypothetical protein